MYIKWPSRYMYNLYIKIIFLFRLVSCPLRKFTYIQIFPAPNRCEVRNPPCSSLSVKRHFCWRHIRYRSTCPWRKQTCSTSQRAYSIPYFGFYWELSARGGQSQHEMSPALGYCFISSWGYISSELRPMSNPLSCVMTSHSSHKTIGQSQGSSAVWVRVLFPLPWLGHLACVHEVKPCFLANWCKRQLSLLGTVVALKTALCFCKLWYELDP